MQRNIWTAVTCLVALCLAVRALGYLPTEPLGFWSFGLLASVAALFVVVVVAAVAAPVIVWRGLSPESVTALAQ